MLFVSSSSLSILFFSFFFSFTTAFGGCFGVATLLLTLVGDVGCGFGATTLLLVGVVFGGVLTTAALDG
jgi:hypothetical protein